VVYMQERLIGMRYCEQGRSRIKLLSLQLRKQAAIMRDERVLDVH
jgi:hypothetical protein